MASRSFLRWMGLLIPRPSSKSSSVSTSSTWDDRSKAPLDRSTSLPADLEAPQLPSCVPCHFWCSPSRLGCTWASPWRPPARPGPQPPSTATCRCFEWALPAGVGPAVPLHQTGSAVWGCQSLQWWGYGVAYRRDIGVKKTFVTLTSRYVSPLVSKHRQCG